MDDTEFVPWLTLRNQAQNQHTTGLLADFTIISSYRSERRVLFNSFISTSNTRLNRLITMFQEFKIAPGDVRPLRHFDEDKMSFESFQFRKRGPKVRIPTYASQPQAHDGSDIEDDYESDEFYPADSLAHRPSAEEIQQRKRLGSDGKEEFIASSEGYQEGVKYWAGEIIKWVRNPAAELQELTGWTYTPVSYTLVFLVGMGCGTMYYGWLTDLASD